MLHILLGATCNNNCLFCMESDRDGRRQHVAAQSREDIRAMILSYRKRDELLFTSGEPTLSDDIFEYARLARDAGFRTIGVISNGRRFAYGRFTRQLVEAGVNRFTVSVHGHVPKLHDSLTRTPGSFEQTRRGLANLYRLERGRKLRIHTSTVVTRRNLPHLPAIHRMLAAGPVDLMVLNVVMAKGRAARHFDSLVPAYGEVAAAVRALCAGLSREELARLRVEDMPLCFTRELPAVVRGELERFEHFETVDSTGITELPSRPSSGDGAAACGQVQARLDLLDSEEDLLAGPAALAGKRARLESDRRYYLTDRSLKERFERTKGETCAACVLAAWCPGVYARYVEGRGWDELRPFGAAEVARDPSLAALLRVE